MAAPRCVPRCRRCSAPSRSPSPSARTGPMADVGPFAGSQGGVTQGEFADLARKLHDPDPAVVQLAARDIRKMLSVEGCHRAIDGVIQAGCVPQLVKLLERHDSPMIQFHAAWALTNVISGTSEQCDSVIRSGACPRFVALMDSPHDYIREQAVWALGNIAGDSAHCRDLVINAGGLDKIVSMIHSEPSSQILCNATWSMSNCLRTKPEPDLQKVALALPIATRLLASPDDEVVTGAAWTLGYASDGPNDRIDAVLAQQPLLALVALMQRDKLLLVAPALRTVANIVTGSAAQTQAVIDAGALPVVKGLLNHPNKVIRKESCWFISNLTAGTKEQIQAVLDCQCLEPVIDLLSDHQFEVRKEALWALSNLTASGTPEQLHILWAKNVIGPVCQQLELPDPKIVVPALGAIEGFIRCGETIAAQAKMAIHDGCIFQIEQLQHHASDEVSRKAASLLEELYEDVYEDEDEDEDEDSGMCDECAAPPAQGPHIAPGASPALKCDHEDELPPCP